MCQDFQCSQMEDLNQHLDAPRCTKLYPQAAVFKSIQTYHFLGNTGRLVTAPSVMSPGETASQKLSVCHSATERMNTSLTGCQSQALKWYALLVWFSSVHSLSPVRWLFATPWIAARQASLSSCPQSLPASRSFPMSQQPQNQGNRYVSRLIHMDTGETGRACRWHLPASLVSGGDCRCPHTLLKLEAWLSNYSF